MEIVDFVIVWFDFLFLELLLAFQAVIYFLIIFFLYLGILNLI